MAYAHFERLSAIDLSFLAVEDGRAHMHIGSVAIFDAEPMRCADGGLDFERILSFVEGQLHKVPRYRQRLEWVPAFGQPVWVDDERFNLRFHVRHAALPAPGDLRLLKRMAGRVLSQEFDRAKPLWEYWFVDGLEGDRFALIAKVHHCMADGATGVAMANLLIGPDPDYDPPPPRQWIPRPAPDGRKLIVEELRHRAGTPLTLLRSAMQRPERAATQDEASGPSLREVLARSFESASATPLNAEVGPHRRFDWTRMPFAEVRAIGASAGGTLNDAVLAIASGALRTFLGWRGVAVDELDFRAFVPVSVRRPKEGTNVGNRVSALVVRLPIDEADAWQRLRRVVEETSELKASGLSGAGDAMGAALELLPTPLLTPLFRRAARSSVANMVITNVPGVRVPVYLLGARQLEVYPVVPLAPNHGLGIALLSYDDGLYWGLNSDWDAVPDLHEFVGELETGFRELRAVAQARQEGPDSEPSSESRSG